jgi:hypothetical protein
VLVLAFFIGLGIASIFLPTRAENQSGPSTLATSKALNAPAKKSADAGEVDAQFKPGEMLVADPSLSAEHPTGSLRLLRIDAERRPIEP